MMAPGRPGATAGALGYRSRLAEEVRLLSLRELPSRHGGERDQATRITIPSGHLGNLRTNSGAVLKVAAIAGHGLVCLPTYLVGNALQSGRLVTALDDYTAPPLTLRALYPHSRHLSAKVRAFVDFLASRFGREPPWDSWCRSSRKQSASPASHRMKMTGSPTKPRRSKTRADAP
jgi:DNA-binding transcriptional LysR family regulator